MLRLYRGTAVAAGCAAGLLLLLCASPASAQDWTAEDCAACHAEVVETFDRGPHSALDEQRERLPEGVGFACSTCHQGDIDEHIESGGEIKLLSFGDDTLASAKRDVCMTCHGTDHPRFDMTSHARAGLDCSSCHSIHETGHTSWALLKSGPAPRDVRERLDEISATCAECHSDVLTQFEFNERHRLKEGILTCASCHDPHQPATRANLGGFKQEACVDCHTDKGGPFVFEHPASRVEGCVSCHTPHGSPNRHLLTFQNVAEMCFSCHAEVPAFHFGFNPNAPTRFGLDTQCTNCHSSIHGSNFDPAFLK